MSNNIRFHFVDLGNEYRIMDCRGGEFIFVRELLKMTEDEVLDYFVKVADKHGYTPSRAIAKKMAADWYAQ